jgi:diaminohydroxyphosphoribosylaminopyrimidine deaminase/5-amino-6-(5-phosphoribosylamino)uracil reductase
VIAKVASSLDGRVATAHGESQWVTGPLARRRGRGLRTRIDAILVGSGTVLADDPRLTARRGHREPIRVLLDGRGRLPAQGRLVEGDGGPVRLYTARPESACGWTAAGATVCEVPAFGSSGVDLDAVLVDLRRVGVRRLLVEGGPTVLGSFFDQGWVDAVVWFLAPRILGGEGARSALAGVGRHLDDAPRLSDLRWERLDQDWLISGWLPRP